jgi:hypothetical protein
MQIFPLPASARAAANREVQVQILETIPTLQRVLDAWAAHPVLACRVIEDRMLNALEATRPLGATTIDHRPAAANVEFRVRNDGRTYGLVLMEPQTRRPGHSGASEPLRTASGRSAANA